MNISINCRDIVGPYGGVASFTRAMKVHAEQYGHRIVHDLQSQSIDVIIITAHSKTGAASFSFYEAKAYQILHPKTAIVLRVNECDERKGTHYMNRHLIRIAQHADFVIFVGSWLKPLLEQSGLARNTPSSVILSGGDTQYFHRRGSSQWNGTEPLRLVTHHWGGGALKGHDIYQRFDTLLSKKEIQKQFSFTFIGNIPPECHYEHTTLLQPLSGSALGDELRRHHVYITASINEPSGNHHIEGALCGLPILYRESGALPEYCAPYGIGFTEENFEKKLSEIRTRYSELRERLLEYPHTAQKMAREYFATLETVVFNRQRTRHSVRSEIVNYLICRGSFSLYRIYGTVSESIFRVRVFLENRLRRAPVFLTKPKS